MVVGNSLLDREVNPSIIQLWSLERLHLISKIFMKKNGVLIGTRPPLNDEYRAKLERITAYLNQEGLDTFTGHDTLLLCIDRAHRALFPEQHTDGARKKFLRIDF